MEVKTNKLWSREEIEYLEENWSCKSVRSIAQKLGRTETAIIGRAEKKGLGGAYASSEDLNAKQIADLLNVDVHAVVDRWIKKYGLKAKKAALIEKYMWRIRLADLIEWLELNQDKWDASRLELFGLGTEPDWLKEKRKRDIKKPPNRKVKWTKSEEYMLVSLYNHGLSRKEISRRLNRTEIGIQRKISKLVAKGILKQKKVIVKWSAKEEALFRRLELQGLSDEEIAFNLGREKWHIVDHRRYMRKKGLYEGRKKPIRKGVIL